MTAAYQPAVISKMDWHAERGELRGEDGRVYPFSVLHVDMFDTTTHEGQAVAFRLEGGRVTAVRPVRYLTSTSAA